MFTRLTAAAVSQAALCLIAGYTGLAASESPEATRAELIEAYHAAVAADGTAGRWFGDMVCQRAIVTERDPRELVLTLTLVNQQVVQCQVTTPRWNRAVHPVLASEWTTTGQQLSGRLHIRLISDGYVPADNASAEVLLSITGTIDNDGLVTGQYELSFPEGPGDTKLQAATASLSGALTQRVRTLPPAPNAGDARAVYADLRGLATAIEHGLDADAAITAQERLLPASLPAWPLPQRPTSTSDSLTHQPLIGPAQPDDQRFGPWYPSSPLPVDDTGAAHLPVVDPAAPQTWATIATWRVMPAPAIDAAVPPAADWPLLPSVATSAETITTDARGVLPEQRKPAIAVTTVNSPTAQRVWLAVGPSIHGHRDSYRGRASLRVNGRLLWRSDSADRPNHASFAIIPVDLQAGENQLQVRFWQRGNRGAGARVAIATAGSPLTDSALQQREQAIAAQRKHGNSERASHRGFSINWTGHQADATPPVAWDIDDGTNIRWRTPMPGLTTATPIVTDGLIFTMAHPRTLLCLDADTGSIRWQHEVDVAELLNPEQQAELAHIRERLLQTTGTDQKHERSQLKAAAYRLGVDPFEGDYLPKRGFHDGHWQLYGPTASHPIWDGERLFVRTIEGAVAAFDATGTRLWMVHLPVRGHHGIPGLILADGVLVVEGHHPDPTGSYPQGKAKWMVGLDPATGTRQWQTPIFNPRRQQGVGATNLGSPIPVVLSNGSERMTVIVTATGSVVRASDGHRLIEDMTVGTGGTRQNQGAPVAHEDLVVFPGQALHSALVQLHMRDRDTVGWHKRWHQPAHHNNYGALIQNGRVYQHSWYFGPQPWKGHYPLHELVVLDLENGRTVDFHQSINRDIRMTTTFPQMISTGRYLWAGSTDTAPETSQHPGEGTLTVLDISQPQAVVVARNRLPRYYGTPVAVGDRLYVRGATEMLCIAADDDTGHTFAAHTMARTIFKDLPERPTLTELPSPPPSAARDLDRLDVERVRSGQVSGVWQVAVVADADAGATGEAAPVADAAWAAGRHGRAINLLAIPGARGNTLELTSTWQIPQAGVYRYQLTGGRGASVTIGEHTLEPDQLLRLAPGRYQVTARVSVPARIPFPQLLFGPRLTTVADPIDQHRRWLAAIAERRHALETALEIMGADTIIGRTIVNYLAELDAVD